MRNIIFCILWVYIVSQSVAAQQLFPRYTCTTTTTISQSEKSNFDSSEIHYARTQQGPPGKRGVVGPKGDKGDPCRCDVIVKRAIKDLRNEWDSKILEYNDLIERLEHLENLAKNLYSSIKKLEIQVGKNVSDISPDADGWIVMQRRQGGSVDFYRNWESYANGFGNRQGEFWLGLRNIHKLTSTQRCKLLINMTGWNGTKYYAEYATFRVTDEEALFRLNISGYSGNIGDRMAYHNGQAFSANDSDNDVDSRRHCAQRFKGGWWYRSCQHSNLNGEYCKSAKAFTSSVRWSGPLTCLRFVEMKMFCS